MYQVKLIMLGLLLICINPVSAWWDTDWENRREIQINNTLGSELTYYQVYVNLTDNPINSTSLRVVNELSGSTVPHWQETITDNNCTALWFNATFLNTGAWVNETYYIYYNNIIVISSNITNTFIFGDDFSGSFPGTKWTGDTGYGSVSEGVLTYTGDDNWRKIFSDVSTIPDMACRCKAKHSTFNSVGQAIGFESLPCCVGRSIIYNMGLGTADDAGNPEYTDGLLSATTWYIFDLLQISGTSVELLADGVSKVTHTTRVGTIAEPVNIASHTGGIDVDWIFTRKYISDEPNTILGNEEEIFIPPNPINLDYTRGFFWVNYTWDAGTGNVTDSYNVSHNGTWTNNSSNTYYNSGDIGDGGYSEILIYAYNNSGCLSEGYVTQNISAPSYTPSPIPINLGYTKGTYWVNHTWAEGADGFTTSYNVSHNGTWTNGSNNAWFNSGGVGRNGISTIIIYAYNGILSEGYITQTISTKLGIGYEQKISNKNIQSIYFPLMFILLMFIVVGAFKYMFMGKK